MTWTSCGPAVADAGSCMLTLLVAGCFEMVLFVGAAAAGAGAGSPPSRFSKPRILRAEPAHCWPDAVFWARARLLRSVVVYSQESFVFGPPIFALYRATEAVPSVTRRQNELHQTKILPWRRKPRRYWEQCHLQRLPLLGPGMPPTCRFLARAARVHVAQPPLD